MIPLSLLIQNIGPHGDTRIDFRELPSPLAVVGEYGSGKTYLIEAIFAALYGEFAFYPSSIYDALTLDAPEDGLIHLTFEHEGEVYSARQVIKRSRKREATIRDAGGNLLAGPKISDFNLWVEAHMGLRDTALSTWFLSQNRALDLIGTPGEPALEARRRGVFSELIGARDMDRLADRAGELIRERQAVATELEAQLLGEGDLAGEIQAETGALTEARRLLAVVTTDQQAAERDLEAARTALRDAGQADDAVLRETIEQHARLSQEIRAQRARVEGAETECRELEARAAGLSEAQADAATKGLLERDRLALRAQAEKHAARKQWEREEECMERNLRERQQQVTLIEGVTGVDDDTRALAGRADDIAERGKRLKAENERRVEANVERQALRTRHRTEIAVCDTEIGSLERRIASAPEAPFGDKCAPCPLMLEWSELPPKLDAARARRAEHEKALTAIAEDEPLHDLAELRAEWERAAAARKAIADAERYAEQLADLRREISETESAIRAHGANEPDAVDDPAEKLAQVQRALDHLAGAEERVKACEQAGRDLTGKREALRREREALTNLETMLPESETRARNAETTLAERETARKQLADRVQEAQSRLEMARDRVRVATQAVARHEAHIHELERRQTEALEKRARLSRLRYEIGGLQDNRACWGPRGVRQILIDDAVPELEAIADDLFERATGGRMRLSIHTQRANQDGSISEAFEIRVRDARGERDALRYSGGQQQLIRILFRIATAVWVGRLRGQTPECLVLDETFDQLGADGSDDLWRVLEWLGDRVRYIITVTHDPAIAARHASTVRVEAGLRDSRVIVGGGVAA